MRYYCTYFDYRYAAQGLALYHSLRQHSSDSQLWVLCLDEVVRHALTQLALPGLTPIALTDLESADPDLLTAKADRSLVEYYFTLTPALVLFLLQQIGEGELLTYLDADLFFFAEPEPLFEELGANSIAIIAHHFPPHLRHLESHGIYNVGWLTFRRDAVGLACLSWWRERCLEWCYDRVEDGRFADQKYLDDWPTRFAGVVVVRHPGANVGPWNLAQATLERQADRIYVNQQPLVFFHFHGLKSITSALSDTHLRNFQSRLTSFQRRCLYQPYLRAWHAAATELEPGLRHVPARATLRALWPRREGVRGVLSRLRHFLNGQYVWM